MLVLEVYAVLQLIVLIVFRPKNEKTEHQLHLSNQHYSRAYITYALKIDKDCV